MPRKPNLTASGYNAAFAKNLRTLIDETGISQQVLADSLPMKRTRQAISQYAAGITTPDYETLIEIARYFNVSVDWLIGYSSVRSSSPELRAICEYTGLSEKTVLAFNSFKSSTNKGLSDVLFSFLEFCCSETDAIDEFESIFSQIEYALLAIASTNYSSNNKTYVYAFDDRLPEFNYALAKHGLHLLLSDDVEIFHRNATIDHFRELLCLYLDKQSEVTTMSNEPVSARDILSLMDEMLEDKNNGEGE